MYVFQFIYLFKDLFIYHIMYSVPVFRQVYL